MPSLNKAIHDGQQIEQSTSLGNIVLGGTPSSNNFNTDLTLLASPSTVHSSPNTPFQLLSLPQELVDKIYYYILANGDLGILRASRQVNEQAANIHYATAIFKIVMLKGDQDFGTQRLPCNKHFNYDLIDQIQNLEIHTYLVSKTLFESPPRLEPIASFTKSGIHRKTCRIIYRELEAYVCLGRPVGLLNVFKSFLEFETVAVIEKIAKQYRTDLSPPEKWNKFDIRVDPERTKSRISKFYGMVQEELEQALGPAVAVECEDVPWMHYIEFHPRAYNSKLRM